MRWSEYFLPTLKEDPQEAEAKSHKLMTRGGMIRRLTSGAYIYLPAGFKVLRKAEEVIRQEMLRAGAQELLMPALHPVELWQRTGRYDEMGEVMISFNNRHGRRIALGPTHEEVITGLMAGELRSYKQLPLTLYQIQSKFRDELRPRFGIVRSCEFVMKDAYSFDVSAEQLEVSYSKMYEAYCRIFTRCGLDYVPVKADPGLMGGKVSHEFMVPAEIGEDRIAVCTACDWASSGEVAECVEPASKSGDEEKVMKKVPTPGKTSVGEVSEFLNIGPEKIIKAIVYMAGGKPVVVLLRGDHDANEIKIKSSIGAEELVLADEGTISKELGSAFGYTGPVGLKSVNILADLSVKGIVNGVSGSNLPDTHLVNVNPGRDFQVDKWSDLRDITVSDICPECGCDIEIKPAIEVGHTFKLGTKYSDTLGARFLDEKGEESPAVMGCYGIGVNRILASLIENSGDDDGMVWPVEISPFEVCLIPVKEDDPQVKSVSEKLYTELSEIGVDVIIDDRASSPGVKFKDADLVGFPLQVVIGKRSLKEGKVELKTRSSGEKKLLLKDEAVRKVREELAALRDQNSLK